MNLPLAMVAINAAHRRRRENEEESSGSYYSSSSVSLTFMETLPCFIPAIVLIGLMLFFTFMPDGVSIEKRVDEFGILKEKVLVVDGGSSLPKFELRKGYGMTGKYYDNVKIRTKDGVVISYSGKIVGEDYVDLINYLSEGCRISHYGGGRYAKVTGWYFRFTLWRYINFN